MGIFGKRKLAYDGPASPPLAIEDSQSIAPMAQQGHVQTPPLPAQKQGFFGQGGFGRYLAGSLGDALARNAGMGTPFMDAMQMRAKQDYEDQLYQRRGADDWAKFVRQHEYRAANPQPDQYERTLQAAGYVPGTPEYVAMMKKRAQNQADPARMVNGPDGAMLVGGAYGYPGQTQQPEFGGWPDDEGGAGPQTPRPFR